VSFTPGIGPDHDQIADADDHCGDQDHDHWSKNDRPAGAESAGWLLLFIDCEIPSGFY
jgi:hypothetical protein